MLMDCEIEQNLKDCPCTYTSCSRRGKCCACLKYHWSHGELPGCLFPPEVEKTWDRSLKKFIEVYKGKV